MERKALHLFFARKISIKSGELRVIYSTNH